MTEALCHITAMQELRPCKRCRCYGFGSRKYRAAVSGAVRTETVTPAPRPPSTARQALRRPVDSEERPEGDSMRSFARATLLAAAAALPMQLVAQSGPREFSAERLVAPPTDGWPTNGGN